MTVSADRLTIEPPSRESHKELTLLFLSSPNLVKFSTFLATPPKFSTSVFDIVPQAAGGVASTGIPSPTHAA